MMSWKSTRDSQNARAGPFSMSSRKWINENSSLRQFSSADLSAQCPQCGRIWRPYWEDHVGPRNSRIQWQPNYILIPYWMLELHGSLGNNGPGGNSQNLSSTCWLSIHPNRVLLFLLRSRHSSIRICPLYHMFPFEWVNETTSLHVSYELINCSIFLIYVLSQT